MTYEVFIKPGHCGADIEADSADQAKAIFVERLVDNIDSEHVEAVNLDTEDGEDPVMSCHS